jgi:hypothetical protein
MAGRERGGRPSARFGSFAMPNLNHAQGRGAMPV